MVEILRVRRHPNQTNVHQCSNSTSAETKSIGQQHHKDSAKQNQKDVDDEITQRQIDDVIHLLFIDTNRNDRQRLKNNV